MPPETESSAQARRQAWAIAVGAGSEFVGYALAGYFAGDWLDGKLGSSPWGSLLTTIAGITLGLYRFVRAFSRPHGGASRRG
jgi:ATP synthase protein I